MADCVINPSFLRGFDFKLLYAPTGAEEYRVMSHDPLTGELLCLPWGHQNILRSTDWGYTFERQAGRVAINTSNPVSNFVFDARCGLGRHIFLTGNRRDMRAQGINSTNLTGEIQFHHIVVGEEAGSAIYFAWGGTLSGAYPGGVGYANGSFLAQARSGSLVIQQWQLSGVVSVSPGTGVTALRQFMRWPLTRGSHIYGLGLQLDSAETPVQDGQSSAVLRRFLPATAAVTPTAQLVDYFVDANTTFEFCDFKDYSGVQPDGAVAIERNGRMWRCTAPGLTEWVRGEEPPVIAEETVFPHVAAGQGRFGEPVLLSLDLSGTYGLLSVDHGQTSHLFELPLEVSSSLPGGACPTAETSDMRFPRAYDIKYISDPASNHTKGRWILCGGLAVWEMVPVYGA